jgi:hypothetical protein
VSDQALESQRVLGYQQGKTGAAQQPAFGAPVAAASGGMAPFGQQGSSLAQPATTSFAFVQPQTTPASFQLRSQSQAQQRPFAGFGAAAAPAPSQPMNAFGATLFGHPAGNTAPAANIFGAAFSTGADAFSFPSAAGTGSAMPSAAAQPFGRFAQAAPGAAPVFGAAPTNAPFGTAAFTSPFGVSSAALPAANPAVNPGQLTSSALPFGFPAAASAFGSSATEAHPDLPPQLLQRISSSDPALTKLEMLCERNFNEAGCRVLARALSLNTCITSLNLLRTSVGDAGACVLFPALTHLTAMTYLNLNSTGLGSSGASHLCSALTHLTAMSKLYLGDNRLTADDGARICGAAAAAGMTRLQALDLNGNGFTGSHVVGCGAWRQLNLPQPPDEIVRRCSGVGAFGLFNVAPFVSYLLSDDKVSCHAIRIFVVGDTTVPPPPPPPPPSPSAFAATSQH